jgi:hypothetical protein
MKNTKSVSVKGRKTVIYRYYDSKPHITRIPRGWHKMDPIGRYITNGIDEMEYVPGFGYILA